MRLCPYCLAGDVLARSARFFYARAERLWLGPEPHPQGHPLH
jgi:hypothetical protein